MTAQKSFLLSELASRLGGTLTGNPDTRITHLGTLQSADAEALSFFANARYLNQLKSTQAGAVLITPSMKDECPVDAILVENPYLAFAQASQLFDWRLDATAGIHPSAVISDAAQIDPTAEVGPQAVVEAGAVIAAGAVIGAGSVVGRDCRVGENTRLEARVTLYPNVSIGRNSLIHSGAVIGADGFGFAPTPQGWEKICQLGGVRIGDNVEVGACTTIDRGALDDTVIEDGVKLDDQVLIAHNVVVGRYTAIAGCTAVAGSTKIGERCTIAGHSGITGHLQIADGTHVTAMSLVSRSITKPGVYSSGTGMEPHRQWKRNVVRFRQLDELARRVRKLEQAQEQYSTEGQTHDGC